MSHAYAAGAAYVDGRCMPVAEAAIPVTHFGWRRSDVTYDVVGVWEGSFFRLDDHLARFAASRAELRMTPQESDADLRAILHRVVALSGLRSAYVSMECLRGVPVPGKPRHPAFVPAYTIAMAIPWVWVAPPEMIERGMHLMVSATLRIPPESVEPRAKNFHWGDMTRAQFEALEVEADFAILPDLAGNITEGPGFNVFSVTAGVVSTPIRGGTDGSRLTEMGVPTPNLFTGMTEIHGPLEWISVQDMAAATGVCLRLAELAAELTEVSDLTGRPAWIVPGVAVRGPAGPDVMRGEETQVVGAGLSEATIALPGTHSKWVELRGGRIAGFRQALARQHHLGAQGLGAPDLGERRRFRHVDGRRHAELAGMIGDALGVVAGRCGDDA